MWVVDVFKRLFSDFDVEFCFVVIEVIGVCLVVEVIFEFCCVFE